MAFLEKFRAGAHKAAIQASAFAKDSSTKVASGSRDFVQGFSLPGEADKAAKILHSFLGMRLRIAIITHVHG
jgi:SH3 domain-containing YSC84-like protein 1